jgi:hypothetical protein
LFHWSALIALPAGFGAPGSLPAAKEPATQVTSPGKGRAQIKMATNDGDIARRDCAEYVLRADPLSGPASHRGE